MAALGPSTLTAPVNLVTIQARLALADDSNPKWEIQPSFLVFGRRRPEPAAQVHGRRRIHARATPAEVFDAWTATAETFTDVVCLGVALAPVACSADSPEGARRFAVAIAGAVTLACNREDLRLAAPGDTLYWEKERSDLEYIGVGPGHKTAVIKALPWRGRTIQRADYERAIEVHLARDPAALAFYKNPDLQEFDTAAQAESTVGGRIGTLLALGEEGTNECLVHLQL